MHIFFAETQTGIVDALFAVPVYIYVSITAIKKQMTFFLEILL